MQTVNEQLFSKLQDRFPSVLRKAYTAGLEGIELTSDTYHAVCVYLKEQAGYNYLSCLTAIDWPQDNKMEVIIHLENLAKNSCLQLTVSLVRTDLHIATITDLWHGAKFFEREVFDLFGIIFDGHKDLKRILSPDDETTFPLRKDFTIRDNDTYGAACMASVQPQEHKG